MELIVLIVLLFVYSLPITVAAYRGHRSVMAIAFVNILFGWTVGGWIWALIWSLSNTGSIVIINNIGAKTT